MKAKTLVIYLIKKLSNLTFSTRHETNQQYHVGQILHRNWNFLELVFFQGHQCPLPLGLICLQDAQSPRFQTSLLKGVETLLTYSPQVFH